MKCPHCLLELRLMLQYDKEVDQCPKCEGIWLDKNILENIFDFDDDQKVKVEDFQDIVNESHDNKLQNEYYYYKKPFKENEKLDDMFDFE
jgi:uncharacterized protein